MNPKTQEYWIKRRQEEWRRITSMGKRFEEEDCSGYIYKGHRYYDWRRGPTITGKDFPYKAEPIVKSPNPWRGIK